MRAFITSTIALALLTATACDRPAETSPQFRLLDQYPGDVFAFGCSYPDLGFEPNSPTIQDCAAALATCIDSNVELCGDPLKGKLCISQQESCMAWARDSCWPNVKD